MCGQIQLNFPTPGNDLWSRAGTKIQISLPRDSKIIQMPFPLAKAIDQNPSLDIDRCITFLIRKYYMVT